jgi:bifunctional non-homologous end joining protein LigD
MPPNRFGSTAPVTTGKLSGNIFDEAMRLRSLPWEERRRALVRVLRYHKGVALSEHVDGAHGSAFFRAAVEKGLEGIVSKRRYSAYRSGRCADWVKVKNTGAPAATRVIEG